MKIVSEDSDLSPFLHYISCHRNVLEDRRYLHVKIQDGSTDISFGELEQFLVFHMQNAESYLLKMPSTGELLLFVHADEENKLNKFERAAYENFDSQSLRALCRGFERDGLEQFGKIIQPHIKADDKKSQISFKRMGRMANNIVVLDDDMMVLKQMEKVVSGFGNVVLCDSVKGFQETYVEQAPNILFLDIHLREGKGNSILKGLKKTLDPDAHVIMISSDTNQDVIVGVKDAGADGFVVKPVNRDKLYQQIMKAPTMMKRA